VPASEYASVVTRFGRRPLVILVLLLACALVGYELMPRDETRIRALLDDSCTHLNQTKDPSSLADLQQFLAAVLLPQVSVRIAELGYDLQGIEQVSAHADDLLEGVPLSFALNSVEVKVSGRLARVEAELLVSARGGGEQRREVRHTRVRLAKHADRWQIEAVQVDPIAPSEPEARP
jgi:ketosteroid isomerase-like protein